MRSKSRLSQVHHLNHPGIKVSDLCLENMFWKMGHYLEIAAIEANSAVSFLIFKSQFNCNYVAEGLQQL